LCALLIDEIQQAFCEVFGCINRHNLPTDDYPAHRARRRDMVHPERFEGNTNVTIEIEKTGHPISKDVRGMRIV
jgi:hypothetical protein